jgi:hypothetical protein
MSLETTSTGLLGYSDVYNLRGFTTKRCQIIFFSMFVLKKGLKRSRRGWKSNSGKGKNARRI